MSSISFNTDMFDNLSALNGLSNEQVFLNPSLATTINFDTSSYTQLTEEDNIELQAAQLTYNNTGLLFSSNPVSALQPDFDVSAQAQLLNNNVNASSLSVELINAYLDSGNSIDTTSLNLSA